MARIEHVGEQGPGPVRWARALLASAIVCISLASSSRAADFANAKKIFVPASRIDRRVDYSALSEREGYASPPSSRQNTEAVIRRMSTPASRAVSAGSAAAQPAGAASSHLPSKSGLVPPPPPIAPSILQSSAAVSVPPPPPLQHPAQARSGSPASKPQAAAHAPAAEASTASIHSKAQELIKQGKLDEADGLLRGAFRTSPKNTVIINDLSQLNLERSRKLSGAGDIDGALRAAREAVYINPASQQAASALDDLLRKQGINPADALERAKLGELLASQGRETAAKVEFKQSLKLRPNAEAHVGLGNLALRSDNKALAKSEYQQALELNPNSAVAHRQIGMLRLAQGDIVAANSDLSRAVILDPADKIAGKHLVELWQRQVSKNPTDANTRMGMARAYQLTGDLKSAQAEYRQVVRLDPNNANLPAARQSFKLALARQEAERAYTAARTLESQGAFQPACDKVLEAIGLSPSDARLKVFHGELLEKMGNLPQAQQAYMAALRDDPQNTLAAQRLRALTPPNAAISPFGAPPVEAPPLAALPAQRDQVSSLSNFLANLREHQVGQKAQIEKFEDHHRKVMDHLKNNVNPPAPAAAPPGLLASAPSGSQLSGTASSLVSAVAPLAASTALGAAGSLAQRAISPAGTAEQPAVPTALSTPPVSGAPLTLSPPSTNPIQAPYIGPPQFAPQPPQAAPALAGTTQAPYLGPPQFAPQPPQAAPSQWDFLPGAPPAAPPAAPSRQAPSRQAALPAASPPAQASQPVFPAGGVRLELQGFTPSKNDVRLKVVLRNELDTTLTLPARPTAVIRNATTPEARVKASFPKASLPAHGAMEGTIKIAKSQIDASSDLYLENILPAGSPYRNIHLMTPTAYRQQ